MLADLVIAGFGVVIFIQFCDSKALWKRLRAIEDVLLEKARLEGDLESLRDGEPWQKPIREQIKQIRENLPR